MGGVRHPSPPSTRTPSTCTRALHWSLLALISEFFLSAVSAQVSVCTRSQSWSCRGSFRFYCGSGWHHGYTWGIVCGQSTSTPRIWGVGDIIWGILFRVYGHLRKWFKMATQTVHFGYAHAPGQPLFCRFLPLPAASCCSERDDGELGAIDGVVGHHSLLAEPDGPHP